MSISQIAVLAVSLTMLLSTVLVSNEAYAGVGFEDNFVHAQWTFPPPTTGATDPDIPIQTGSTAGFPLFNIEPSMTCDESDLCVFQIPNFVDELQRKIIFIDITFATGTGSQPSTPTVLCNDSTGTSDGILLEQGFDSPDLFIFDFKCIPNPDWEQITIQLDPNVIFVEIWTKSFSPIGGEIIPIDTTSLLLAGVQTNLAWIIPIALSIIGISVILVRKKF